MSCFGLTNPTYADIIDGGAPAATTGTFEADLDIEQAATQAPNTSIIAYEGPNTAAGAYEIWTAIVKTDVAQVVSTSWGECEPQAEAAGTMQAYTILFEQAATQGQTIMAAAGDSGSEGCYTTTKETASEQVDYPASSPWVTAAGGTALHRTGKETAWNYCQTDESITCANQHGGEGAGGGGVSRYEPRSTYQPNIAYWPTTSHPCGHYCREVPDISANAGVGMVVYANGTWRVVGGTSAAAPFVAGLVADKNDGCTTPTGVFAPALYALYEQGVYGTALNCHS